MPHFWQANDAHAAPDTCWDGICIFSRAYDLNALYVDLLSLLHVDRLVSDDAPQQAVNLGVTVLVLCTGIDVAYTDEQFAAAARTKLLRAVRASVLNALRCERLGDVLALCVARARYARQLAPRAVADKLIDHVELA